MKQIFKKIIAIAILFINLFLNFSNIAFAKTEISEANIISKGSCEKHLQFNSNGRWNYVTTTYTVFEKDGIEYPAYCLNRDKAGVGELSAYTVKISDLVDDDRIWRVVVNGYPNKTPEQMGVYDKYDAFVATKQAIYSILYDNDVDNYYRGGDERGVAIVNAIKNMVNEGRYGTTTQKSLGLNLQRVGELTKENNCYTQEYKVYSNAEISEYTITEILGLPENAYITDLNGNIKDVFNHNENFKLNIPKSCMNKNIDITITVEGRLKTYPVYFGKTPNENWQNYAVAYAPYTKEQTSVNLNIKTDISVIKIKKVDSITGESLEGVTFKIEYDNGELVGEFITNEDGIITIKNLRQGKLVVNEIKTKDNYVLNSNPIAVDLEYNEIKELELTNEKIRGQIEIYKTSLDDNPINNLKAGSPISGIPFNIYNENKEYVTTIITDENGYAITDYLDKGEYYICEEQNDSWYLIDSKKYCAKIVNNRDIITLNITNESEKPDIDIEKTGIIQTTANQEIKYDFKIKNTGNVPLGNFTWYDKLPTDYVRITKLITGTYNQDLNYSIYYKTNKNDYRLLKENLNTLVNNYIDFSNLGLEEGEYVTDFKADFGTVDVGFQSVINPYIFVRVNNNVKNDETFTNKTRIEGYNKTYMVWDKDEHTTKVYEKEIEVKKLPKTGM